MGMDLQSLNTEVLDTSYNWAAWRDIVGRFEKWGIDTSEFRFANDGELINARTCMDVADALEAHIDEIVSDWLNDTGDDPLDFLVREKLRDTGLGPPLGQEESALRKRLRRDVHAWRHCGGFRQY